MRGDLGDDAVDWFELRRKRVGVPFERGAALLIYGVGRRTRSAEVDFVALGVFLERPRRLLELFEPFGGFLRVLVFQRAGVLHVRLEFLDEFAVIAAKESGKDGLELNRELEFQVVPVETGGKKRLGKRFGELISQRSNLVDFFQTRVDACDEICDVAVAIIRGRDVGLREEREELLEVARFRKGRFLRSVLFSERRDDGRKGVEALGERRDVRLQAILSIEIETLGGESEPSALSIVVAEVGRVRRVFVEEPRRFEKVVAPLGKNVGDREVDVGRFASLGIAFKNLEDRQTDRLAFLVERFDVGVEFLKRVFLLANLFLRVGGDGAFRRLERLNEFVDHRLFVRFEAVQFEAEIFEPDFVELIEDDVERRLFLGDEKDLFPVVETFGDHVGNRLTFARSRRSLQDETLAALRHNDGVHLTGVRVDDRMKFEERIRKGRRRRLLARFRRREPDERANDVVLENPVGVRLEVLVHREFEEREDSQFTLADDFPSEFADDFGDLREVGFQRVVVLKRG